MARLGIDEVMNKLYIEYLTGNINVKLIQYILEGFQVVAKLQCVATLQQTAQALCVNIAHQRNENLVGTERQSNSGAVHHDGHIAVVWKLLKQMDIGCTGLVDRRTVEQRRLVKKRRLPTLVDWRLCRCCRGFGKTLCLGRVGNGKVRVHALGKITEFQFRKKLLQLGIIRLPQGQLILVELERCIQDNRRQLFAKKSLLGVLHHQPPDFVILYLVGAGHHFLYRPELGNKLLGRLLPHSRNAGDVVGRVAPEAQQILDLFTPVHAELLLHLVDAENLVGSAHVAETVDMDMLRDKLCKILVGGHHDNIVEPLLLGPVGGRAYHIVGLVSLACKDRDVKSRNDTPDIGQTHLDCLRHCLAVRLILGIHLMTERGLLQIESHCHVGWLQFLGKVV